MSSVATLVLAGTKPGEQNRALIPLNGRPMLDYVLDAVRKGMEQAGYPGRLLIAGENLPLPDDAVAVAGGVSLVDTLLSGASALTLTETRLLVVTSDIPFLTPDAVADFLARADTLPGIQFLYSIIEAEVCRAKYPEMRRTTLRVAEGEFTGGNIVMVDPGFLRENEAVLREAYAQRKSVSGLARLLGPSMLLRMLASRVAPALLTIPQLEAAVSRALGGASARAIITPFAEIGADVDRPEDFPIAERVLASMR